jgi:spore coat polysaccharide biosynthesis protein SpsF (cytidylyltransferase family)
MMASYTDKPLDLITNVQKRTFPHGHSVELLRAESFSKIDAMRLSSDDREHVTKYYYSHADEFKILNLENMDADYAKLNFVVDTLDDLRRVEAMESRVVYDFAVPVKVTAYEQ